MKKYDLLTEIEQIKSVQSQNGMITSTKNSNFEKIGLRKFENGQCYYFSYFGDIAPADLIQRSEVVNGTGINIEYVLNKIQPRQFFCESLQKLNLDNFEMRIDSLEKSIEPYTEHFSINGDYKLNHKKTILCDDSGSSLEASRIESTLWYRIKRNGSASIMDAYFWNCSNNITPEHFLECFRKTLDAYDLTATLPAGKYPVLFAQQGDAEGSFLEKIKSSLKADIYYENSGLLSGKLGSRYFDNRLTIVDSNINTALGIYAPFDGEGFIRKKNQLSLIENGIVTSVIADQRLASKYKIEATGNGKRDYKSAPRTDFNSVEILPGPKSTEAILKSLPLCVVVMMGGGGDFTDIGDYSQPIEFSYLFEYGEVVGRLAPITVRSTVQKMFGNDLIEIASDNYFKSEASPSVFMQMDVLIN